MSEKLFMWTVYQNTLDFPGQFVARKFELDQPTEDHFASPDIDQVRNWIKEENSKVRQGTPHRIPRSANDDPVIVETWL